MTDPPGFAQWNMARDEAIFLSVQSGNAPPTMRLYSWREPAISIGRFQPLDRAARAMAPHRAEARIVRRITGGRAVLHGTDLTVSISAGAADIRSHEGGPCGVYECYAALLQVYVAAFASLGLEPCSGQRPYRRVGQSHDCFKTHTRADIVDSCTKRKLLGSAIHRSDGFVLQQASIPLGSHRPQDIRGMDEFQVEEPELRRALIRSITALTGLEMAVEPAMPWEESAAEELIFTRYSRQEWTQHGRTLIAIDSE
ncbi:MAG TPA: hypothetical protein VGS41_01370 [Chthonomonadales bacterium]|nr:hypothetical protein [Chthonomonadales bacterium]